MGWSSAALPESLRIATFNTELSRKGPGLLLRDIARGKDPQILAVAQVIGANDPDIIAIQDFDYDLTGAALSAFADLLGYPHHFARLPNTGMATDFDMDGNGRKGEARDAMGYGTFSGQGGMAILSKYPILTNKVQDFSDLLWVDAPDALLPTVDDKPFPSAEAQAALRLSTTAHWIVPIDAPSGVINIATFHASPPVFDGPEDRNGKRNHDEIMLWMHILNGKLGTLKDDFVIVGDANLDPVDGDGLKPAIATLLAHPRLQDSAPKNITGSSDTVDWTDPVPGNLRVDYVLPSANLEVTDSGVHWPTSDSTQYVATTTASRHRLVWVDIAR